MPFAGHPVLGTAFVLARERSVDKVELVTKQGPVSLTFDERGRGRMGQPLPTIEPWNGDVDELLAALGIDASLQPIDLYYNGVPHLYVVLDSLDAVAGLRPDFGRLGAVAPRDGVNCVAGQGTSWKSRMFGPGLGVHEDPATGSAAGPLAVHLCRHDLVPWGTEITITQGSRSAGRPRCTAWPAGAMLVSTPSKSQGIPSSSAGGRSSSRGNQWTSYSEVARSSTARARPRGRPTSASKAIGSSR